MFEVNEDSFTITMSRTITIPMEQVEQLKAYNRRCGRVLDTKELADTYDISEEDAAKVLSHIN